MKIIDIQDKYSYKQHHIEGSVNIPYDDLLNNYRAYLNKDETYYIYCKSGKLSKRIVTVLNAVGYKAIILEK